MAIKEKLFGKSNMSGPGLKSVALWLWEASKGQQKRVLLSCLTGVFEVACSLGFVWASKQVIDVATNVVSGSLWTAALIAASLLAGQLGFAALDMWLSGCMPVDVGNRMRSRLFNHVLRSRWKDLDKYHTGDVLNRINRDIDDVVRLLTITIPAVFVTVVQFVASFAYFCKLDASLAWLLILVIPVFLIISKLYVKRMREYNHEIRKSDSRIQSVIQESIQHHVIIKTLERKQNRLTLLDGLQVGLRKQVMGRTRLSLFSRMMMSVGFNSGYLLVFLWGAMRLSRGDISFGTMTAFLQLVGRVQRPAFDLTSFLPSFITAYTAAERLIELETLPVEDDGERVFLEGPVSLSFRNVTFAYAVDSESVFKHFNVDFPAGTTTAVLGVTGAGKTTLIRLILALVTPQQGSIVLNEDVLVSSRTRANFVYVPQGNTLFSGTIRENLLMGNPNATTEQMENALRIAVANFVFTLPEGIDTVLSEQGGGVSEGQAQRISIARALLRDGGILLFDEATSALDQETERRLVENLRVYCKGKTVIFITHHPALAEECDRVLRV